MLFVRTVIPAVLLTVLLCQSAVSARAQYGISIDIKKPPEYDNRVLRSEKTAQKKIGAPSRFLQNTTTHYNYFFNANNKLTEVLAKAKAAYKDDYSQLLAFYNYTLDATASDTLQLDSISYKTQTGIVLHDLRSDWADNLYLLWGISYYLKKQFDSAYLMFQFINYAFAEKESDGYYKTIGSGMDGNNAFSISTKEKNSLPRKILSRPPSRNDAFIWQIRNLLELERYAQAASFIAILKNDPLFPSRLKNDLEEVEAYAYYKQKVWDSSAAHLSNALSNATGKQEKARWEYLLGQLYELSGNYTESEAYYASSIHHTTDPVMDIYARLGSIRVNKEGGDNYIEKNIATLVKMGKKDKYADYRDIIYFMAAQMELERTNTDGAIAMLLKSTKYTSNNPSQRNKAFLQLAELSFNKRRYRDAYNFYDSLNMQDPELKDPDAIAIRKDILQRLAANVEIVERQDSLQRLAALPEDERKGFVRKLARQLRRQQGLKDDGGGSGGGLSLPPLQQQQAPALLFTDNNNKGEWYFYNSNLRQKGLGDFKSKWGNRANTDNWRRSAAASAVKLQPNQNNNNNAGNAPGQQATGQQGPDSSGTEITFESLYENLPLTQLKLQESNDSINAAMFALGLIYIQELEDCEAGAETLQKLKLRSPDHPKMDEILFNLYYCTKKRGSTESSYTLKKELSEKFPESKLTAIVNTGKNPEDSIGGPTKTYEDIYALFIEGNFPEAIAQKKSADSLYGQNYWTPQLLYIEAVYYIRQQDDSTAKKILNDIITKFSGSPLADKATNLLSVLNRRKEIEEELRNLVIVMPDTSRQKVDTTIAYNANDAAAAHYFFTTDSTAPPANDPVVDTSNQQTSPPVATAYKFETDKPHYVVLILNKVDPIFVAEAKNAFNRYNRNTYYNKQMTADLVEIDNDNRLLIISPFNNLRKATDYVDQTKPKTPSEILPWLKGGKYSYSVITEANLELLKSSKNIDDYKQFVEQHLPGKF